MENVLLHAENESWEIDSVFVMEESLQNTKAFQYTQKDFFFPSHTYLAIALKISLCKQHDKCN